LKSEKERVRLQEGHLINSSNKENSPVTKTSELFPFFSSYDIEPLLKKLKERAYTDNITRNNLILEVIKIKQPISKYELAKITNISYPTIKQICKEFQFVGLIKMRIATGENGMPVQLVYIEEQK